MQQIHHGNTRITDIHPNQTLARILMPSAWRGKERPKVYANACYVFSWLNPKILLSIMLLQITPNTSPGPELVNSAPAVCNNDNPFDYDATGERWAQWEGRCEVPPVRFALVNLTKPYDLAHAAQVCLAAQTNVPHVCFEMVGNTLDFSHEKIASKVCSWNIPQGAIPKIPRRSNSLANLIRQGFRLIGTDVRAGKNALAYTYAKNDVIVIGGANGLSQNDQALVHEVVNIPSAVPFLTTVTVIPLLAYKILQDRGLWH
jgi:hypothetical protein